LDIDRACPCTITLWLYWKMRLCILFLKT
jgi:hypothetical protein